MSERKLRTWDWRHDPTAPQRWRKAEGSVCIVDDLEGSVHRAVASGATFILAETPARLAERMKNTPSRVTPRNAIDRRMIPAVRVTTQEDMREEVLLPLLRLDVPHRAIIVDGARPVNLGLLGTLPKAWVKTYSLMYDFIDLVVLRDPAGACGDQRVSVEVARYIRDQVVEAGVAFLFAGADKKIDGRRHLALPGDAT